MPEQEEEIEDQRGIAFSHWPTEECLAIAAADARTWPLGDDADPARPGFMHVRGDAETDEGAWR